MLTITLNNPGRPPGTELAIRGLGVMVNGQPRQLTADEEKAYWATTGKNVVDLNGRNGFTVDGTSEYVIVETGTVDTPGVGTQVGGFPAPPVAPFIPGNMPNEESEVTN